MSIPKFKIGEEVILESKNFPQYNGEYTIKEIISKDEHKRRYAGIITTNEVFYVITDKPFLLDFGKTTCAAKESVLRKKHKGSKFSFESLMENLKKIEQKA